MDINIDKVKELMGEVADGNYNEFARLTQINVGQLYRILNKQNTKAGTKTISRLITYLKSIDVEIDEFIFLH